MPVFQPPLTGGERWTLFDMMQIYGIVGGGWLGITMGTKEFGIAGTIVGGMLGFVVGHFLGVAPWWICWAVFRLNDKLTSTARLKNKLQTEHFHVAQLIAEMIVRGESVESSWPYILSSLRSDSLSERHCGWENLQIWFPSIAKQIKEFDPANPVERCREYVTKIESAEPCAAPLPIEPSFVLNWYDRYLTFFIPAIVVVVAALSNFEWYGWCVGGFISTVLFAWRVGSVHSTPSAEYPATPRL